MRIELNILFGSGNGYFKNIQALLNNFFDQLVIGENLIRGAARLAA